MFRPVSQSAVRVCSSSGLRNGLPASFGRRFSDSKSGGEGEKRVKPTADSWLKRVLTGTPVQPGQKMSVPHSSVLSERDVVYEIATHDVRAGELEKYFERYEKFVNLSHEKDPTTKLLGSWSVMVGHQNQAIHLWRYEDGWSGVDRHMQELWDDPQLQAAHREEEKLCFKRKNCLLHGFSYWKAPEPRPPKHIYELRSYVLKPGSMIEWANNWARGITYRRDFNQDVGGFFAQVGKLYMVFHLWAYKDLATRKKIREDTWEKPGWDSTVQYTVPLIKQMRSRIMMPAKFSPMQ